MLGRVRHAASGDLGKKGFNDVLKVPVADGAHVAAVRENLVAGAGNGGGEFSAGKRLRETRFPRSC